MNGRTVGIISTAASVLLCGCPGLFLCVWGLGIVAGMPVTTEINGVTSTETMSPLTGLVIAVFALLLIAIPLVVGFLTLRKKPGQPQVVMPAAPAPSPAGQPVYQPEVIASPPQPAPPPAPFVQPVAAPPSQMDASAQEVYNRIVALNRGSAPYHVIDGRSENVDLIAEWKIADAQWYEIFGKAKLTKVFRIYLKLDSARREVRAMDREYNLQWSAGIPRLSAEASFFRGQKASVSFGTGYAFTEELAPGQVYKYKFSTNEIKKPIQDAVASCGWKYKGVAFGKL